MKNITKILSVALVAMMVLSLSAVALAEDTTVYIPARLGRLVSGYYLEDYAYPTLSVHTDAAWNAAAGEMTATEDAITHLQFSEAPDWAGANVNGWTSINVDASGYGEIDPWKLQPGYWSASGYDDKGNTTWHVTGAWTNTPYHAGKDYGDYAVNVDYAMNGEAWKVAVTLKDSEDFFKTGMEGGTMTITFEKVDVKLSSSATAHTKVWYISQVSATYPEGNYIIGVEADFRNDSKQNLCSYRVSYAVSEKEIYKITYAPNTASILEDRDNQLSSSDYTKVGPNVPSTVVTPTTWNPKYPKIGTRGVFVHHYTADEAIYGEFYTSRDDWSNGTITAVSGSGSKLNKWYKNGHGAQVRNIKKGTSSFKSPRVK